MNAAEQLNWCWSGVTERLGDAGDCSCLQERLSGCDGVPGESSQQWWQLMCAVTVGIWGGLDGFGGILFADENFQEAEFGLDPLVLPVLVQHRHPVLLLNVSAAEDGGEKLLIDVLKKPRLGVQWHMLTVPAPAAADQLSNWSSNNCPAAPLHETLVLVFETLQHSSSWCRVFSVYWGETAREKQAHTFFMIVYQLYYSTGNSRKVKTPESLNLSAVYTTAARNLNWTLVCYFYQPGSESVFPAITGSHIRQHNAAWRNF